MVLRLLTSMRMQVPRNVEQSRALRPQPSHLLPPQSTATRRRARHGQAMVARRAGLPALMTAPSFWLKATQCLLLLLPKKSAKAGNYVRGPQPALYRDPKSGATWSGRGRAPAWIANAKNRDRFLVGGAAATLETASASKGKVAAKKASKALGAHTGKGQPKGPQPALYRDPKSGATWSGRGRAPAWMADAKDQKKFLIA